MGKIWEMKEEEGGGGETASIVAGNPTVIWDHPGSRGVGGVCVCACMHMCVPGLGVGSRQAQRNICSGPQGWPRVRMYL